MKLLIPLTVYSGLEQAFVAGEFTRVKFIISMINRELNHLRINYRFEKKKHFSLHEFSGGISFII